MTEPQEVTAPTKVCPNCGAQAQTLGKKCPHCGKGYKKRTLLKVFVGLCVLGLIGIIGCAALIGGTANEISKQLSEDQEKSAISTQQFKSLELGMTEQMVRKQLGKAPQDRQALESEGILSNEPVTSTCIYYNQAEGEWLDTYQLCFENGRLTSKNDW